MQFGFKELVELAIRGCPELEKLPIRGPSCLERIIIDGCGKLKALQLNGCQNLKSVLGLSNLANLVELEICDCGKLEFDHLCLSGMKCLQKMTFHRNGKVNYFEIEGCQNLKTMQFGCEEVVEFSIRGCPKLAKLPIFAGPSCLERIIIDECGKFERLQVDGCQNLKSVSGNFELRQVHIINCPELEEVPNLDRLRYLWSITIHSCEKLQNISGIEEWNVSHNMSLCYCSNALIRSSIRKLKNVQLFCPAVLIGRAVDGAESTSNQFSFSEFETYALTSGDRPMYEFIVCFVIKVDSSSPVEEVNKIFYPRFQVRQGERIITMVVNFMNYQYRRIEDSLRNCGILKGAFCVKGIGVHVLRAIVDKLYHS
ncbi:hypothetical protein SUGI_0673670 [Cryptomeria japonica]|nr:hypothetical protein SUGI_0673670 [Cryptomeria japonica]